MGSSVTPIAVYSLIGYIPFSDARPSFALPVFEGPRSGEYFIQVADPGRDAVMLPFAPEAEEIYPFETSRDCVEMSRLVYVFIEESGLECTGTSSEIAPRLWAYANSTPMDSALLLQIAEIVGSAADRREARQKVLRDVERVSGQASAEGFRRTSLIFDAAWRVFCEATSDEEGMRQLLSLRRRISRELTPDDPDFLPDDTWNILTPHLRFSKQEVTAQLQVELPDNAYDGPSGVIPNEPDDIDLFLSRVNIEGRQEARVALLLRSILEDRERGLLALRKFHPRRKFERIAKRYILEQFLQDHLVEFPDELTIARAAQKLYAIWFPLQRGLLLFELARQLANYPHIAAAIREKALASRAFAVQPYVPDILACLDSAREN